MTIIYFLILLSVIICIHEAGHLLAAKLFNVYCYEFSFGMGPALFKKQGKETLYAIRLIPMGGFVAMAGENSEEAYPEIEVPDDRRLYNKPVWQRIIILLAGVFMNFLLCFVILSMVYLWAGAFSESPEARIVKVMDNSPAERAGLQEGDAPVPAEAEDSSPQEAENCPDDCPPAAFLHFFDRLWHGKLPRYSGLGGRRGSVPGTAPSSSFRGFAGSRRMRCEDPAWEEKRLMRRWGHP